jgi:hypothetical protein
VPSRTVTKVVRAAAVAVVVELIDPVLDKVGISEQRSGLVRALLKSSVAVVSGVLLGKILKESEAGESGIAEPPSAVLTDLSSG